MSDPKIRVTPRRGSLTWLIQTARPLVFLAVLSLPFLFNVLAATCCGRVISGGEYQNYWISLDSNPKEFTIVLSVSVATVCFLSWVFYIIAFKAKK
jgi:hypothetical protein